MTRVELLRDLYVWAYERATQEYVAIRQDLAEPDPLRLSWRELVRTTIREVVLHPEQEAMALIRQCMTDSVPEISREAVQALVVVELRRLHEGVLARYGLRPSEFMTWRDSLKR